MDEGACPRRIQSGWLCFYRHAETTLAGRVVLPLIKIKRNLTSPDSSDVSRERIDTHDSYGLSEANFERGQGRNDEI